MASNSRLESLEDNIQDLKMGLAGSYNMTQSVNNKLDQNFQYVNLVLNPIIKKLNDQNKDIDLKAIENNYNNLAQENLSLKKQLNDVSNEIEAQKIELTTLKTSNTVLGSAPSNTNNQDLSDLVKKIEDKEIIIAKAEEGRVTAEKKRKDAEENRIQEEIFRDVAEDERVKVEKERVEKENERVKVEDRRGKAEEERVKAEEERKNKFLDLEENWTQNEDERIAIEELRKDAEEEREDAEKKREDAEEERRDAEDYRNRQETDRILMYQKIERDYEENWALSEQDRKQEEINRADAEDLRIEQEKNRNKNYYYILDSLKDLLNEEEEEEEEEEENGEEEEEEENGEEEEEIVDEKGEKEGIKKKPFTKTYYYRSESPETHVFAVIDDITQLTPTRFIKRIRSDKSKSKSKSNENLKNILKELKNLVRAMEGKDLNNLKIKDVKGTNIEFQEFLSKNKDILSIPVLEVRKKENFEIDSIRFRLSNIDKNKPFISILDFYYAFVIESGHEGPNNEYKESIRSFFNEDNEMVKFLKGFKKGKDIFLQPNNTRYDYLGQVGGDLKSIYEIIYRN